ncbi:unnamed protein product [Spodoptera littoralis]|uniref:Carboxypeptidase inhibitor n=1 Tax=Spodoptera littoralis TaxID=7109 RepID=A0A9P0IDC3_SPOLI|nr:unnamed protein product [Spodoptera littoralis]
MCTSKFVFILSIVCVLAKPEFKILDSIDQEGPCISQGGMCTIAGDCPAGHLVEERGLCPKQQKRGVECCYGLSVKETRCKKRGGECFPGKDPCNEIVRYRDATDCPKDTTCCILVRRK